MPAPKPRHQNSPASNQVPEQLVEPVPTSVSVSQPREAIFHPAITEQFLPESIELCCPVCGYSNFSQNEVGETNCNECDYMDSDEVLI